MPTARYFFLIYLLSVVFLHAQQQSPYETPTNLKWPVFKVIQPPTLYRDKHPMGIQLGAYISTVHRTDAFFGHIYGGSRQRETHCMQDNTTHGVPTTCYVFPQDQWIYGLAMKYTYSGMHYILQKGYPATARVSKHKRDYIDESIEMLDSTAFCKHLSITNNEWRLQTPSGRLRVGDPITQVKQLYPQYEKHSTRWVDRDNHNVLGIRIHFIRQGRVRGVRILRIYYDEKDMITEMKYSASSTHAVDDFMVIEMNGLGE